MYYLAQDYQSAIVDYNKSIDLKPDFALAYSNCGYAYRDLYGEHEALLDWRFAAKLFKEQGNITKYQSTMRSIVFMMIQAALRECFSKKFAVFSELFHSSSIEFMVRYGLRLTHPTSTSI